MVRSKILKGELIMSLESAKAFIERMKTDEDFRKKVTECKDGELRKALIKAEGFDFTKEDIELVKSELSEEALEGIVGGYLNICFSWCSGIDAYT
jgi:predicted ribosomally synthesized peptide with nif11-like leader